MIEIKNFRNIPSLIMKNRNYTVITGDDEILLKDICDSIYFYYNDKKLGKKDKINDLKLEIVNYFSKVKEKVSSKQCIYFFQEKIEEEFDLGSKTVLYSRFNNLFKEKLPTEPILITINSLIEDLEIDKFTLDTVSEISKYSDYQLKFSFDKLTSSDLIKKIKISVLKDENDIEINNLTSFEKLKITLGILDEETIKDKIYIFLFPEKNISIKELKELKKFLLELSKNNKIIIATFSKYLFEFSSLDNLNIYQNKELKNLFFEEELIKVFEENYPIFETKENISQKLKSVLNIYLGEFFYKNKITNKFSLEEENLYINDYEHIFLLLFYLKLSKINYQKDIEYNHRSPFSNYIEEKL